VGGKVITNWEENKYLELEEIYLLSYFRYFKGNIHDFFGWDYFPSWNDTAKLS
jgi:hypothetical protein